MYEVKIRFMSVDLYTTEMDKLMFLLDERNVRNI